MPGAKPETLLSLKGESKVFYVTTAFPPIPAGSSIINRNLLSKFSSKSFNIYSTKSDIKAEVESFGLNVNRIFKSYYFSSKVNYFLSNLQIKGGTKKIIKEAECFKPSAIVGVYPDYYFLKMASDAAKELKLPFIAYLHDTISESSIGTRFEKESLKLQEDVFINSSALLVMSDGMKQLYKKKYNIDSITLEHTYLEKIPDVTSERGGLRQAFWGGDVYAININSVRRMSKALDLVGLKFFIATSHKKEYFEKTGFDSEKLKIGFFENRKNYLKYLTENSILVLALDWPDESNIHEDELATIFPTKTPEYLASGRPIIVHCPKNYFLANFFLKNDCGFVVSDKDPESLSKVLNNILKDKDLARNKVSNALKAAKRFDSDLIAKRFKKIIESVYDVGYGQKLIKIDS